MDALSVIDGLQATAGRIFAAQADEAITNGKIQYMQGATEAEIAKQGNKYTTQGYETMHSINSAQEWFANEANFLAGDGQQMDPQAYHARLNDHLKSAMSSLPNDPAVRKAWVAAYDGYAPRLAAMHIDQHNKYNEARSTSEFTNMLMGGPQANTDSSTSVMGGTFRVNAEQVEAPVQEDDTDRDTAIRTMLGEAGGEGAEGMAAVAHVLVNRSRDPRWPSKISNVALQPKQFSAWNTGAGGNNPQKYSPDSDAYRRAGAVWDAVASGHHVDPTGGATHYYSPSGMKALVADGSQSNTVPAWLEQEASRSGGKIQIGGHVFVGKSAGSPNRYVDPMVTTAYRTEPGQDVQPSRTSDAGKFIPSTLVTSPQQAQDMGGHGQANGPNAANDSAAVEKSAQQPQGPSSRGTQIQRMIASSPLPMNKKAAALSDAMRRSFDSGDDTLFNDAGGTATLYHMGATPADVDSVIKAKKRFDDQNDKKFDLNFEKARADLLTNVQSGNFATVDDALGAVDKLHTQFSVGEAESKSLARDVAAKWQAAGSEVIPLELRDFGAQLHDGVQSGRLTPNEAGQQIIDFGKKNPAIKEAVINNFVQDMYSTAQQKKDTDRTKAQIELDKQTKENLVINRVNAALVRGSGLKGLSGTVRVPDSDNPGASKELTGEEYGVWALKKRTMDDYNNQVAGGTLTKEKAQTSFYSDVYSNLAKQGVYDTDFGRQISAAVSGPLIGTDKKLRDGATAALDVYMQLRDNPNIGSSYLAGMIPDEKARTFLETAAQQYDHRHDLGPALMAADSILSQKLTPVEKLEKTSAYMAKRATGVTSALEGLTGRGNFWQRLLPNTYTEAQMNRAKDVNAPTMQAYITNGADQYHRRNPTEPMDVSIQKASDDLARNSVLVGSDVIIGDESKGTRLDQVMGLNQQGRDAPNLAIAQYLKKAGPSYWRDLWVRGSDERSWSTLGLPKSAFDTSANASLGDLGVRQGIVKNTDPTYKVTYIPDSNAMEIQLFKDPEQREVAGPALYVDPKTIGDWYKKQIGTGEAPWYSKPWRTFVDTVADRTQDRNAQTAGSDIGSMFTPTKK
jgi:spore germination cell wall hydrolase CwlJ-like protein